MGVTRVNPWIIAQYGFLRFFNYPTHVLCMELSLCYRNTYFTLTTQIEVASPDWRFGIPVTTTDCDAV